MAIRGWHVTRHVPAEINYCSDGDPSARDLSDVRDDQVAHPVRLESRLQFVKADDAAGCGAG